MNILPMSLRAATEERNVVCQQAALLINASVWLTEEDCGGAAKDSPLGSVSHESLESYVSGAPSDDSTAALACDSSEGGMSSPVEANGQKRVRFSLSSNEIIGISPRPLGAKRGCINDEEVAAIFAKAQEDAARREVLQDFLMVEGFLSSDVNSARRNLFKKTFPLHVACKRGNEKVVELLLASGADATLRDSKRRTPADVAKGCNCNGNGSHDAVLYALGYE